MKSNEVKSLWRPGIVLLAWLMLSNLGWAQQKTKGTVSFTVTTVSYGGKYSDKNIGAIWVENAQNQFVKTLQLWANKRKKHLVKWNSASGGNTVDAITSATFKSHKTHNVSWDGTDVNGTLVDDGNYKIFAEFTEDNSSKSGNPPGKWIEVDFTKGPSDQTVTPPDETYFKNIKLVYTVDNTPPPSPASLSGTVRDATSGSALANVTILLKSGGQVAYQANTDGSGNYAIDSITAGTYTLEASFSGYNPFQKSLTLSSGQNLTGEDINLQPVPQPASLAGTVRDASTNSPLQNATVQLQAGGQVKYETQSDGAGNFSLQNVTAGSYTLVAFLQGYESASENITLNAGQNLSGKEILLTPVANGANVSGKVIESGTGQALADVRLQLNQGSKTLYETTSLADGSYAFKDVKADAYVLVSFKNGYATWSENLTLSPGQNLTNKNITLDKIITEDKQPPSPPPNLSVRKAGN